MRISRVRDFFRMAEMVNDHSQMPPPFFIFHNPMPLFKVDT